MVDTNESSNINIHETIALQAYQDFNSGKYESCKSSLDQLMVFREKDVKVEMNLALLDYYISNCNNKKIFFSTLQLLIKRLEMEDDVTIDNEFVIIYYNYAIMLYEMRRFNETADILEKILQNSENLDEEINNKINLLLVDVFIKIYQPFKALSLIDNIDKVSHHGNSSSLSTSSKAEELNNKEGSIDCAAEPNKFIFVMFRTCCDLMLRSVKQSKRDIKTIVNSISLPLVVSYLKSNIELLRGNYTKSLRLLSTILDDNNAKIQINTDVIVNNNMAVIYFNERRYSIAQIYIARAINDNKKILQDNGVKSNSVLNADLLYNLGITMLMSGHPDQAFQYLIKVTGFYKTNARLWLRLAECCIQLYQKRNDADRDLLPKNKVIVENMSSGMHHKLILHSNHCAINKEKEPLLIEPSLKFASLCLDNALHCLNHLLQLKLTTLMAPRCPDLSQSASKILISAPSTPLATDEWDNVRCSVLTAKCYIHLKLDDPLVTLHCVSQLFAMPKLSGLHRYLAAMYRAEALLQIDQLSDIADILNVDNLLDINLIESDKESTASLEVQEQADSSAIHWFPRTLEQARSIMHHNLAITYALRGENEKSRNQLDKAMNLLGKPYFSQMSSLRIYIDLKEGIGLKKENIGQ